MAGFGVVWAAIAVILFTPTIGLALVIIAFRLSQNEVKIRKSERRYASKAKEYSTTLEMPSISKRTALAEDSTIRSRFSSISERSVKTKTISLQITGIADELKQINKQLNDQFGDKLKTTAIK